MMNEQGDKATVDLKVTGNGGNGEKGGNGDVPKSASPVLTNHKELASIIGKYIAALSVIVASFISVANYMVESAKLRHEINIAYLDRLDKAVNPNEPLKYREGMFLFLKTVPKDESLRQYAGIMLTKIDTMNAEIKETKKLESKIAELEDELKQTIAESEKRKDIEEEITILKKDLREQKHLAEIAAMDALVPISSLRLKVRLSSSRMDLKNSYFTISGGSCQQEYTGVIMCDSYADPVDETITVEGENLKDGAVNAVFYELDFSGNIKKANRYTTHVNNGKVSIEYKSK